MKNRGLALVAWLFWYVGLAAAWHFVKVAVRRLRELPQRVLRFADAINQRMFQPTWMLAECTGVLGFALRAVQKFVDWLRMIKALWLLGWIVRIIAVTLIIVVAIPVLILIGVALLIKWFFYDKVVWPLLKWIGRGIKWFFYDKVVWPLLKWIGRGIKWVFYDKVVWPLLKWIGRGIKWVASHPAVRLVLGVAVLVLTFTGVIPLLGLMAAAVAIVALAALIVLGVLVTFVVRFGVRVGKSLLALVKRARSLLTALFRLVFLTVPLPALPFAAIWAVRPRRSWGKPIVATVVVATVVVSMGGVWGYQSGRLDIFSDRDDAIDYAFSPRDVAKLSESVRLVQVVWGDSASGQAFFTRNHTGVVTSNKEIIVSTEAFGYQLTQQEIDGLNAAIEAGQLTIQGPISILGAAILPSSQDRVQQPEIIDLSVKPAVHNGLALMSLRRGQAILDVTPATLMAIEDEIKIGAKLFTVDMYEIPGAGFTEARVSQHVVESVFNKFVFFSDAGLGQPVFVIRDGEPELIGITSLELDGMVVAGNVNPYFAGFFQRLGIDVDITRLK